MGYRCYVVCDGCGIEWVPKESEGLTMDLARHYARSRGWKVGRKIGWLCPRCVERGDWKKAM